jgi:hypothetical protein
MHLFGRFMCISVTSPNTHKGSQLLERAIIWHILLHNIYLYVPSFCLLTIFQLPKNIQEVYIDILGEATTGAVNTHLKRELMHAIWNLILDGKFMEAYEHGLVILCSDGITRRVFPRFFSYSADYPEK